MKMLKHALLLTLMLLVACKRSDTTNTVTKSPEQIKRIICMAPSITETVYLLDKGDAIVGRSTYSTWPKSVKAKPDVGSLLTPNIELIVGLRPDLVILVKSHEKLKDRLNKLGIETLTIDHNTVSSICESIKIIGDILGQSKQPEVLLADVNDTIEQIRKKTSGRQQARVLVCVHKTLKPTSIKEISVAGPGGFMDELLEISGGKNCYTEAISYPTLNREDIMLRNPDIIIDFVPDLEKRGFTKEQVINQWKTLSSVTAVKNNQIHVFSETYTVRPGPRFPLIIKLMIKALHPDLNLSLNSEKPK